MGIIVGNMAIWLGIPIAMVEILTFTLNFMTLKDHKNVIFKKLPNKL